MLRFLFYSILFLFLILRNVLILDMNFLSSIFFHSVPSIFLLVFFFIFVGGVGCRVGASLDELSAKFEYRFPPLHLGDFEGHIATSALQSWRFVLAYLPKPSPFYISHIDTSTSGFDFCVWCKVRCVSNFRSTIYWEDPSPLFCNATFVINQCLCVRGLFLDSHFYFIATFLYPYATSTWS